MSDKIGFKISYRPWDDHNISFEVDRAIQSVYLLFPTKSYDTVILTIHDMESIHFIAIYYSLAHWACHVTDDQAYSGSQFIMLGAAK